MVVTNHKDQNSFLFICVGLTVLITVSFAIISSLKNLCKNCCQNLLRKKRKERVATQRRKKQSSESRGPLKRESSNTSLDLTSSQRLRWPEFEIPKFYQRTLVQPRSDSSDEFISVRQSPTGVPISPAKDQELVHVETVYGKLDPNIYKAHRMSVVAGAEPAEKVGVLHVLAQFFPSRNELQVTVLSAKDLACRDPISGSLDTSASVCLLPDRKTRKHTKVIRKSLNPQFFESFAFPIGADEDVHTRILILQLHYHDYFSRAHLLGAASIPLLEYNLKSHQISLWCNLRDNHSLMQSLYNVTHAEVGDLMFSLKYSKGLEKLTVNIIKAVNLITARLMSSVVYGKVSLYQEGRRLFKKKSRVKDIQKSYIIFNEPLTFPVDSSTLMRSSLRVSLNNYNLVGASVLLGEVELSGDSHGPEMIHWETMFKESNREVTMWHPLRGFKLLGGEMMGSSEGSEAE